VQILKLKIVVLFILIFNFLDWHIPGLCNTWRVASFTLLSMYSLDRETVWPPELVWIWWKDGRTCPCKEMNHCNLADNVTFTDVAFPSYSSWYRKHKWATHNNYGIHIYVIIICSNLFCVLCKKYFQVVHCECGYDGEVILLSVQIMLAPHLHCVYYISFFISSVHWGFPHNISHGKV
jgi:hypothetical protein